MSLKLEVHGPIAHVLIDRPDKRNALTLSMWQELPDLLGRAALDPAIALIVLRSANAGSAFCAGADISELLANKGDAGWREANQSAINRTQYELARLDKPTIAFVEGDCIGGGCGLALACDLRVATPAARFGITPARLGLVYPLHDTKLLTDLVGPGQAKRLLFTAGLLDAEEALRIGLIEQIAADFAPLAEAILAASPHSIRENKKFVRRVLDGQAEEDADTARIFGEAFEGADFAEGAAAFAQKRTPKFR